MILPKTYTTCRIYDNRIFLNSSSFVRLIRFRKISERVHFLLLVLARPGREKSQLRPTKKDSGRQSKEDMYPEKSDSHFDQHSAPARVFFTSHHQVIDPFVIVSCEYIESMIRRLFFLIFIVSKALTMPLVFALSIHDIRIIYICLACIAYNHI